MNFDQFLPQNNKAKPIPKREVPTSFGTPREEMGKRETRQEMEFREPEEKKLNFDQLKPENFSEESKFDSLLRQSAQYTSRAVERLVGVIPDTKQFLSDLIIGSYEKASLGLPTGEKQREAPEFLKGMLGARPTPQREEGSILGKIPTTAKGFESMPTSPELREFSEKGSKGYTAPKTPGEEKIGEMIGDISASLMGGNKSIRNNLLVPIGANVMKFATELAGQDENKQTMAKMGSWMLLGSAANANARKYVSNLQKNARANLAPGTPTDIPELAKKIAPLNREWISGDPRSTTAQSHVNDLRTDLKAGKYQVNDLLEKVSAINADIELKGGFDYASKVPKSVRNAEIRNLNKLKDAIYSSIKDSTRDQPMFFKNYMDAQSAYAAVAQSGKMIDFAKNHYGKFLSTGLATLFGSAYLGHGGAGVAAAGGVLALHKAAQVGIRMYKNPTLRKYYLGVVKATAENNGPMFVDNMRKLDIKLQQEEKKKKIPYKFSEEIE